MATPIDVVLKFREIYKMGNREIGKILRYLPDKIYAKFRLLLKLSLLCGLRPKSARASLRQCAQICSRFHPDRFTFGGVIAERMNTVFCPLKYSIILSEAVLCFGQIKSSWLVHCYANAILTGK